jgi:hypothetical protein
MFLLNHSLLNRGYILMKVLTALAPVVSMCSFHVIFLSKITPRYFILFTNGMFCPFNISESGSIIQLEKYITRVMFTPGYDSV